MHRRMLLTTAPSLLIPTLGFAQTDSAGGVTTSFSHMDVMKLIADIVCDNNPYTKQRNAVTGESSGPMRFVQPPVVKVLAGRGYNREWSAGGETYIVHKAVGFSYQFDQFLNGEPNGVREERIAILYAGNDGPG